MLHVNPRPDKASMTDGGQFVDMEYTREVIYNGFDEDRDWMMTWSDRRAEATKPSKKNTSVPVAFQCAFNNTKRQKGPEIAS